MALDREPVPGRGLTWVGKANEYVRPGDRGVFDDFDGGPESYVVDFGPGRLFCCDPSDVEVDAVVPTRITKRHR